MASPERITAAPSGRGMTGGGLESLLAGMGGGAADGAAASKQSQFLDTFKSLAPDTSAAPEGQPFEEPPAEEEQASGGSRIEQAGRQVILTLRQIAANQASAIYATAAAFVGALRTRPAPPPPLPRTVADGIRDRAPASAPVPARIPAGTPDLSSGLGAGPLGANL